MADVAAGLRSVADACEALQTLLKRRDETLSQAEADLQRRGVLLR